MGWDFEAQSGGLAVYPHDRVKIDGRNTGEIALLSV
jgi:hypothetical protein